MHSHEKLGRFDPEFRKEILQVNEFEDKARERLARLAEKHEWSLRDYLWMVEMLYRMTSGIVEQIDEAKIEQAKKTLEEARAQM